MITRGCRVIGTQGAAAMSLRDLAKEAGVPLGSTYHRIPGGKAQLVQEAVVCHRPAGEPGCSTNPASRASTRRCGRSPSTGGCCCCARTSRPGAAPCSPWPPRPSRRCRRWRAPSSRCRVAAGGSRPRGGRRRPGRPRRESRPAPGHRLALGCGGGVAGWSARPTRSTRSSPSSRPCSLLSGADDARLAAATGPPVSLGGTTWAPGHTHAGGAGAAPETLAAAVSDRGV